MIQGTGVIVFLRHNYPQNEFHLGDSPLHISLNALSGAFFGGVKLFQVEVADGVKKPVLWETHRIEREDAVGLGDYFLPVFLGERNTCQLLIGTYQFGICLSCTSE